MKVLILSANIGNFDSPKQHVEQDIECDFVVEMDFAGKTDNRKIGKFIKMGGLNYGNGYEVVIWIDGNVTITNTAPDQTVALTAGTGISISGTYPNFTVTNSGVTQLTGTANQVTVSASTGSITLSLPATINVNTSGNAATVTNGVYTTGSYADPTWITSLAGSKITGTIDGGSF